MKQQKKHYKPCVPYGFLALALASIVYSEPLCFISYMVVILLHFMWHCHNAATVKALNKHKEVF